MDRQMYEICRLLNSKKTQRARKSSGPKISVGASVEVCGKEYVVSRRDEKYKNAWFVTKDGNEVPYSFSRDMIKIL